MLHAADSFAIDDCRNVADPILPDAARQHHGIDLWAVVQAEAAPATGRYGESRGLNVRALILTILIHLAVIAALLGVRQHVGQQKVDRLVTIDLSLPPPPPPAQTPDAPPPKQSTIAAPEPLVRIDKPQPMNVPVAVDPQPSPPSVQPARETSTASDAGTAPASLIQGGDLSARMVSGKPPRYPTESRRKREQGTVVLTLVLGADGVVEQISVSNSSGFDRLDRAALDAVRKWRWEPVTRGGQSVKVRGTVEIPFVLQG